MKVAGECLHYRLNWGAGVIGEPVSLWNIKVSVNQEVIFTSDLDHIWIITNSRSPEWRVPPPVVVHRVQQQYTTYQECSLRVENIWLLNTATGSQLLWPELLNRHLCHIVSRPPLKGKGSLGLSLSCQENKTTVVCCKHSLEKVLPDSKKSCLVNHTLCREGGCCQVITTLESCCNQSDCRLYPSYGGVMCYSILLLNLAIQWLHPLAITCWMQHD